MEEKKLTDEEIVKSLECCANWLDPKDCDRCPIGFVKCYEDGNCVSTYALDLIHSLQSENAELQKQVDELKEDLRRSVELLKEGGELAKTNNQIIEQVYEKAVKDTAKEILQYVGDLCDDGDQRFQLKDYQWHKNLCKKYGVEVE